MPSRSKAQAKLMNAVAHNKKFAKQVGIPQSVGKEYSAEGQAYKRLPNRSRRGKG